MHILTSQSKETKALDSDMDKRFDARKNTVQADNLLKTLANLCISNPTNNFLSTQTCKAKQRQCSFSDNYEIIISLPYVQGRNYEFISVKEQI